MASPYHRWEDTRGHEVSVLLLDTKVHRQTSVLQLGQIKNFKVYWEKKSTLILPVSTHRTPCYLLVTRAGTEDREWDPIECLALEGS